MAESECIHCNGFGVCDLFLRKDAQARESRARCEENHRRERNTMAEKHRVRSEQKN